MGQVHETVFICGPMSSSGEPGTNLHNAVVAAGTLAKHGFLPYVPHLLWLQHAICPSVAVHTWKMLALGWVERCEALLRLPGRSRGSENEVERAQFLGIPVFYEVDDVIKHFRKGG